MTRLESVRRVRREAAQLVHGVFGASVQSGWFTVIRVAVLARRLEVIVDRLFPKLDRYFEHHLPL